MRKVYPQPGYTEADLTAILETGQFTYADCYTFIPKVGSVMRYTNYQNRVSVVPVGESVGAHYDAGKVIIKGLRVKMARGVEVDEQQLEMHFDENALFQGLLGWPQALLQGRLDGARVMRDRYFAAAPGEPWVAGVKWFAGLVSTLTTVGRQDATVNVKADLVLLNVQMPRDLWEANCKNTWGDPICGVNQADWAVSHACGVGSTRSFLAWTGADATYALGKVHIDNGDGVTRVRTISRADSTGLYLSYPLDFTPTTSLIFTAYPGCSRTMDTTYGCPKYHPSNWRNFFKGFPYVPVAETAVGG